MPAITALALLVAAAIGASFVIGAPIFAIPIVLLSFGALASMQMFGSLQRQRKMKRFREQAKAQKTEFTQSDKTTLA